MENIQDNETFKKQCDIPLSQFFFNPENRGLEKYLLIDSDISPENLSIDMQEIIQEFVPTEDKNYENDENQKIFGSSLKN